MLNLNKCYRSIHTLNHALVQKWAQFPALACKTNMELTVVVSVHGLDCVQHSSHIAPLNGDRDPLEEELEGMRLPCFCLEAMFQFVEELQGLWATDT